MTRLQTTGLASLVFGFTFGGTTAAQSPGTTQPPADNPPGAPAPSPSPSEAPADSTTPMTNPPVDVDVDADADVHGTPPPADTTTTTTVTPSTPPAAPDIYIAPTTVVTDDTDEGWQGDMHRYGIAVSAGGGTGGFTNEAMRDTTNVGGEWDVRVSIGTRSPLALETSYIGSAQSISALGLDDNAVLVGNGAQAALRFNTTIDFPVQPFLYGGAAWRRYDLTNADFNTSDVNDSDNVFEFPLGVGVAGHWQGLILDARGEYRPTIDNDLLPEFASTGGTLEDIGNDNFAAMHRWSVSASIGYEF